MSLLSSLAGVLMAGQGVLGATGPDVRAPAEPPVIIAVSSTSTEVSPAPIPMAVGLAGVNDWSVQQPFLDVMKTARPWIGHKPWQWGGVEYSELVSAGILDQFGWPVEIPDTLSSIGTLILTDLPSQAVSLAGRYRLTFTGVGIVEVSGRARNVRYGKGQILFDYTPGPGHVDIRIQRSKKADVEPGNYVRDISVVKLDYAQAHANGTIFNPVWLDRIADFSTLRFMDWMATNNSSQSAWKDRPRVQDYSWALNGVPLEVMLALAGEAKSDAWFNMPHLADDDYITRFATLVRNGLAKDQKAYVEFSNEVWNWQFAQTVWADAAARTQWGAKDAGVQFYGMRAAQIARIWSGVFGAEASGRLVNVISSQTGWLGLEEMVLNAPDWASEQDGNARPVGAFDAYAVTGYFGGILGTEERAPMVREWIAESRAAAGQDALAQGLKGAAIATYVQDHQYDLASALAGRELLNGSVSGNDADTLADLLGKTLPYHARVARTYDLDLIMYEGGSHVVGIGAMVDDPDLTGFFIHFNYTPEMGALYGELISGWHDLGGQLFNVYFDVSQPSKWGSWGALRYLSDSNPRWDALVKLQ